MNPLNLADAEGVKHFLHCNNAADLMRLADGKECLEIGAFCGGSAFFMAHTAKSVLSVDSFAAATDGQRQTELLTTLDDYKKAVARFPNVLPPIVATSEEADKLPEMAGRTFDLIFVDADHSYEAVRADIARWWPRVRDGGIMAFHDYSDLPDCAYPGVKRAVDEAFGLPAEGTVEMGLRWIAKDGIRNRVTFECDKFLTKFCPHSAERIQIFIRGQLVWDTSKTE